MTQYTEVTVPFAYNASAQFLLPFLTVGGPWVGGWKASGEDREREVIEITGGEGGRCLGLRLELEGWRKALRKPRSLCR